MRRIQLFLALFFIASAASAQNARSAVSVAGSDLNPCTTTSPCRSFSVAVAHTNSGGEVIAFDSGGFGTFTAAQAITVSGAPGVHAAITTSSGPGILVNAGAADAVVLRNLVILNSPGGNNGIEIAGGLSVHVANCVIRGFLGSSGILMDAGVETEVDHSLIQGNFYGVNLMAATVFQFRITNSQIDDNSIIGVYARDNSRTLIRDSYITGNNDGIEVISSTNGVIVDLTLDRVDVVGNQRGIFLMAPDANQDATVRLYGSVIEYNAHAGIQGFVGTAISYGNNGISANNPDFLNIALTPVALQ